jgi:hypothetical protein
LLGNATYLVLKYKNLAHFHQFLDLGHFSLEDMLSYYEEMVKALEADSLLFWRLWTPHSGRERSLKARMRASLGLVRCKATGKHFENLGFLFIFIETGNAS